MTHSRSHNNCNLLSEALTCLENQDLNQALYYCQQEKGHDTSIFTPLNKSVQGVIQMFSSNFVDAIQSFNDGLQALDSVQGDDFIKMSTKIKLYSNLLLSYILSGANHEVMSLLQLTLSFLRQCDEVHRRDLFQQMVYILFRVTKLESLHNSDTEGLYDNHTKACILSAGSLNAQLSNMLQLAFQLEQSAFYVWRKLEEWGFVVTSLRRLIHLCTQLKIDDEVFEVELEKVLEAEVAVERRVLFKGYKDKVKLFKQILKILLQFQKALTYKYHPKPEVHHCWKLAVKLKVSKALKEARRNPTTKDNSDHVRHLQTVIKRLSNQTNHLIQKNLIRCEFTKSSITYLTNHLTNLCINIEKNKVAMMKDFFQALKKFNPRPPLQRLSIGNTSRHETSKELSVRTRTPTVNVSQDFSRRQSLGRSPSHNSSWLSINPYDDKLNKKVSKYLRMCEVGQYINKKNFSNESGQLKYVKVTKTQIRWATDQDKVDKESKFHFYNLKDVKGILYGKFSDTFRKSCNKKLDSWKCFSLVLQKRTLDFYCEKQQDIQFWITGISAALSRSSIPRQLSLYTPGRQRWRRMFLRLTQAFIQPMRKQDRVHHNDVAMSVILFGHNNYRLPK